MPDWKIARCRDAECGGPVIWAITPAGKNTPVDAEPTADGNVLLSLANGHLNPGQPPVATVVNPAAPPFEGWGPLRASHFATCPAAERFRSRRSRT